MVLPAKRLIQGQRGTLDQKAMSVLLVRPVVIVRLVLLARKDHKVQLACREKMVVRVIKAIGARMDNVGHLVQVFLD